MYCLYHPGTVKVYIKALLISMLLLNHLHGRYLLAESCRSVGYKVGICDANAEQLTASDVLERVRKLNPRLICFVVYGQNVNAGTV